MAFQPVAVFQGVPAIYSLQPRHRRRTATSIMAGCFDPRHVLSIDFPRDLEASSSGSSISMEEPVAHKPGSHKREIRKLLSQKRKGSPPQRLRTAATMSPMGIDAKHKRVNLVSAEGKENASSAPPDENSHTRPYPAASLKRKRSYASRDDLRARDSSSKKPRLLESVATDGGSIPSSAASLTPDPISPANSPMETDSGSDTSGEDTNQKLTRVDAPSLYEVSKSSGVRCKLCHKLCVTVAFMEIHLRNLHSDVIDLDAVPKPQERRPRGPRKNVAIRKGWKGWVEEELSPQNLILLDKPEILPERTTRSGRKID